MASPDFATPTYQQVIELRRLRGELAPEVPDHRRLLSELREVLAVGVEHEEIGLVETPVWHRHRLGRGKRHGG